MSTSTTAPQYPFSDLIFEAVCAHETFRKLGFSSDEIYFRPSAAKLHMTPSKVSRLRKKVAEKVDRYMR